MTMNTTQFLEVGGSSCARTDLLSEVTRYSPDPSKTGCLAAYAAFRAATDPPFTCDCSGDHAFLGGTGGLRSGTMFTISNTLGILGTAIIGPALGTWIDHNGGKRVWIMLLIVAGTSMVAMAALGPNFVWMIGLVVSVITIIASELVTIPRQTYLLDLRDPQPPPGASGDELADAHATYQSRVSGNRISLSYAAQIVFVLVAVVLTIVLGLSTTLSSQIITALSGIWYLAHFAYLVPRFPIRQATRQLSGRSYCSVAYGQLWEDLKTIRRCYPEALKYLIFLFIVQNGTGSTVLTIAISFMQEQLVINGLQTQVVFVGVLIAGPLWIHLLKYLLSKGVSYKMLLSAVICMWLVSICLIGLVINNMGKINGSWNGTFILFVVVSVFLVSPGLTWYYSLYWPAFMCLVPEAQVNQFGGLFTTIRTLGLIPQPLIYVACSNAFTSASLGRAVGINTMLIWNLAAIPVLLWVNFAKGRREAGSLDAGLSMSSDAGLPKA